MRLSIKFFCAAYIIVLFSAGIGGSYIIKNINDTLWDTRAERVNTAVDYAADSFLAFSDISYGELSDSQKNDVIRQIRSTLDDSVSDMDIYTANDINSGYTTLNENECAVRFIDKGNRILMETVCRLDTEVSDYYLFVYSDFTDIQNQCDLFWSRYGIVVFCISAASGIILFILTKRITKPLNKLAKTADEIAVGNYGKKAEVKNTDYEIHALSESINSMSAAIQQKINEIGAELENRNRFVADFTHEMKTPMTSIMGYSQLLISYNLNDHEKKQAAKAIYNEAKRLEKLSLQLLDLYVYQQETTELTELNLFFIGEQLEKTLYFLSKKYGVYYKMAFGQNMVWADSVLLLSLLYNLADNAFKASPQKSEIRIYSVALQDCVRIYVEDEGRGIAKENLKLLTEPFYREDKSRSRKFGGAGLGLSLCKEIAAIHGTELVFESEKDKGTRVSFALAKGGDYKCDC